MLREMSQSHRFAELKILRVVWLMMFESHWKDCLPHFTHIQTSVLECEKWVGLYKEDNHEEQSTVKPVDTTLHSFRRTRKEKISLDLSLYQCHFCVYRKEYN